MIWHQPLLFSFVVFIQPCLMMMIMSVRKHCSIKVAESYECCVLIFCLIPTLVCILHFNIYRRTLDNVCLNGTKVFMLSYRCSMTPEQECRCPHHSVCKPCKATINTHIDRLNELMEKTTHFSGKPNRVLNNLPLLQLFTNTLTQMALD